VLFSLVYIESHPRPLVAPRFRLPLNAMTDHCPLPTASCFKFFICNTYGSPRKRYKQKTYSLAKPFRCNTYKKVGVGLFPFRNVSNIQTFRLATSQRVSDLSPFLSHPCALFCAFLHSAKTQLIYFQALPHSLPKTTRVGGGAASFARSALRGGASC